jgi:hypothetical protein
LIFTCSAGPFLKAARGGKTMEAQVLSCSPKTLSSYPFLATAPSTEMTATFGNI